MTGDRDQFLLDDQTPVPSSCTHLLNKLASYEKKSIILNFSKHVVLAILILCTTMFVATMFLKSSIPYRHFLILISVSGVKVFIFSILCGCLCYKLSKENDFMNKLIEQDVRRFMQVCSFLTEIQVMNTNCKLIIENASSTLNFLVACAKNMPKTLHAIKGKFSCISDADKVLRAYIGRGHPQQITLFKVLAEEMESTSDRIVDLLQDFSFIPGVSGKMEVESMHRIERAIGLLRKESTESAEEKRKWLLLVSDFMGDVVKNMISCGWNTQKCSSHLASTTEEEEETVRQDLFNQLVAVQDVLQKVSEGNRKSGLLTTLYNIVEYIDFSLFIIAKFHPVLRRIYPDCGILSSLKDMVKQEFVFEKIGDVKNMLKSKIGSNVFFKKVCDEAESTFHIVEVMLKKKDAVKKLGIGSNFEFLLDKISRHVLQNDGETDKSASKAHSSKKLERDDAQLNCIVLELMLLQVFMLKLMSITYMDEVSNIDKILQNREDESAYSTFLER
ncbi:hypothetical protein K6025_00070 [Ehrlichia sp. JZT12]